MAQLLPQVNSYKSWENPVGPLFAFRHDKKTEYTYIATQ